MSPISGTPSQIFSDRSGARIDWLLFQHRGQRRGRTLFTSARCFARFFRPPLWLQSGPVRLWRLSNLGSSGVHKNRIDDFIVILNMHPNRMKMQDTEGNDLVYIVLEPTSHVGGGCFWLKIIVPRSNQTVPSPARKRSAMHYVFAPFYEHRRSWPL